MLTVHDVYYEHYLFYFDDDVAVAVVIVIVMMKVKDLYVWHHILAVDWVEVDIVVVVDCSAAVMAEAADLLFVVVVVVAVDIAVAVDSLNVAAVVRMVNILRIVAVVAEPDNLMMMAVMVHLYYPSLPHGYYFHWGPPNFVYDVAVVADIAALDKD